MPLLRNLFAALALLAAFRPSPALAGEKWEGERRYVGALEKLNRPSETDEQASREERRSTMALSGGMSLRGGRGENSSLSGPGGSIELELADIMVFVRRDLELLAGDSGTANNSGAGGDVELRFRNAALAVSGDLVLKAGYNGSFLEDHSGDAGNAIFLGESTDLVVHGGLTIAGGGRSDGTDAESFVGHAGLKASNLTVDGEEGIVVKAGLGRYSSGIGGDVALVVTDSLKTKLLRIQRSREVGVDVANLVVGDSTAVLLDSTWPGEVLFRTITFSGGDELELARTGKSVDVGTMDFRRVDVSGTENRYLGTGSHATHFEGNIRLHFAGKTLAFDMTGVSPNQTMLRVENAELFRLDPSMSLAFDHDQFARSRLEAGDRVVLVKNVVGSPPAETDGHDHGFYSWGVRYVLNLAVVDGDLVMTVVEKRRR